MRIKEFTRLAESAGRTYMRMAESENFKRPLGEEDLEEDAISDLKRGNTLVNDATKALDAALSAAIRGRQMGYTNTPNVLLEGEGGFGKSSIVADWAEKNNVYVVDFRTMELAPGDIQGTLGYDDNNQVMKNYASTKFDGLDMGPEEGFKGSILFLDEYNRGDDRVRASLLTLIASHAIPDSRVRGQKGAKAEVRKLKNFLFTVLAMNPADENYRGVISELDKAEATRNMLKVNVAGDKAVHYEYIKAEAERLYNHIIENSELEESKEICLKALAGSCNIAKILMTSDNQDFNFDDSTTWAKRDTKGLVQSAGIVYRNLDCAIFCCNGLVEGDNPDLPMDMSFIDMFEKMVLSDVKVIEKIKTLLSRVPVVKDKRNAAIVIGDMLGKKLDGIDVEEPEDGDGNDKGEDTGEDPFANDKETHANKTGNSAYDKIFGTGGIYDNLINK